MSCCWSKTAVAVIDNEADSESQTITLATGRSLHHQPRPVVNQGSETSIFVNFVSAAAQVDIPDELPERGRKFLSTKSQINATEIVWKPQDSSWTNTNSTLITGDASQDESKVESYVTDSCLLSASKGAANVIPRDEVLFSNDTATTHGTYFPLIVNVENGKLFAFNNQRSSQEHELRGKHLEWLAMPGIGFLPDNVVDIIAGDGGLLCVNGGSQPRKRNPRTPPVPHADDYNHMLYPQQSILVVCNPLTEELKFIPRHTNKKLDDKIACLQILKGNESRSLSKKQVSNSRLRYKVHVVGGHHERSSLRGPASDELVLMTYDSRSDTWTSGMAVGRSRIPAFAKTGIARQEDGFYLGGQEVKEEPVMAVRRDMHRTKHRNYSRGQYGRAATASGCPRSSNNTPVWTNKIFFLQASTLKWHSIDFEVLGEDGLPHSEPLQAPRVVQCRTGGPVYAVTRAAEAARTIEIYEVVINVNGFPTGEFIPVTRMPSDIFVNLFESETSMREYDCAAGLDFICFLVGPPNQSTIGVCDLKRQKWFMSIFPTDPSGTGRYALGKSMWTPDWRVQP